MNALLLLDAESHTHGILDMVRDILVAVVAGLFVPWFLSYRSRRRSIERGLNRTWTEVRHTQKETNTEPFYESSKDIDTLT